MLPVTNPQRDSCNGIGERAIKNLGHALDKERTLTSERKSNAAAAMRAWVKQPHSGKVFVRARVSFIDWNKQARLDAMRTGAFIGSFEIFSPRLRDVFVLQMRLIESRCAI